jgi:hypothetical protein
MTNDSVDEQISVVAEGFDHFEVEVSHRGTVVVCLSDDLQMELPAHGALNPNGSSPGSAGEAAKV